LLHPSALRSAHSPRPPLPAARVTKPALHPVASHHGSKPKSPPLPHQSTAARHRPSTRPSPQSDLSRFRESNPDPPTSPPIPQAPPPHQSAATAPCPAQSRSATLATRHRENNWPANPDAKVSAPETEPSQTARR